MNLDDNDDWIDTPEAIELRRQMASLEEKITNFKQEIETQDNDPDDDITDNSEVEVSKWSKPIYISDPDLPKGWTHFRNREGSVFYRDANGKFLKNRRNVLTEMYSVGGFSPSEIRYIRDGLVEDGWNYHDDLPDGWMFKQYVHKIEGVNTEVLYKLSPNGIIYRLVFIMFMRTCIPNRFLLVVVQAGGENQILYNFGYGFSLWEHVYHI